MLETTVGLCEVIQVYNPSQKKYIKAFAQYDSGGSLSLVEKGENLDLNATAQYSEPVVLNGLDGQSQGALRVILLRVRGVAGPFEASFCAKNFPTSLRRPTRARMHCRGSSRSTGPSIPDGSFIS